MKKVIVSYERSTGKGAHHATQILVNDEWVDLSDVAGSIHLRRDNGFDVWAIETTPDIQFRAYHRTNTGKVTTAEGEECLGF